MRNPIYLSEYINGYIYDELECAKNRSPHTVKSYVTTLKILIVFLSSNQRVRPEKLLLTNFDFDSLHTFMMEKRRTRAWVPSTWNNRLAGVKAFIKYLALIDPKYLELHRRISLISGQKIPKSEIDYLDMEQISSVLHGLGKNDVEIRDRAIISLFFVSGIRNSELTNIKFRDLQWKSSGQVRLNVMGKGRKKRSIPLSDKSNYQYLKTLIDALKPHSEDYIFCTRTGTKMTEANVRRIIKKYFKAPFPNKNITPHSLRHAAAMNWLNSGIDIFTISSILGHEQVTTTQTYVRSRYELKEQRLEDATNLRLGEKRFKTQFIANDDLIKSLNLKISRLT